MDIRVRQTVGVGFSRHRTFKHNKLAVDFLGFGVWQKSYPYIWCPGAGRTRNQLIRRSFWVGFLCIFNTFLSIMYRKRRFNSPFSPLFPLCFWKLHTIAHEMYSNLCHDRRGGWSKILYPKVNVLLSLCNTLFFNQFNSKTEPPLQKTVELQYTVKKNSIYRK